MALLENISLGYVFEVVVPLATLRHNDSAACSIVAACPLAIFLLRKSLFLRAQVTLTNRPLQRLSP
ncbi:MAG: hypothetical protein OXC62_06940, partial [Aestuariivita sp.]|nr:hypothetical protein [Aestuariivita sp.]